MDEENKKINIDSFFNRVEEVSQVAGNALKQSNLNASAIQANKTLINSLSITIETMKTEIRDIANYIVIEKKLEKDIEEDRKLEAEDAKQKQAMTDRAQALSQPTQKGDSVSPQPEQGKGGGFLSGLLKAIAIGGLAALALPLVPVIAPLLLKALAVGIGAIALGVVGKELLKFVPKVFSKIKEGYNASIKFATDIKNNLGDKINVLKSSIGDFLSEKKKQFLDTAGKVINFGKEKIGQAKDLVIDIKDKVVDRSTKFLKSAKEKAENVVGSVKKGFKSVTKTDLGGMPGLSGSGNPFGPEGGSTYGTDTITDVATGAKDNIVGASKTITESIKEGGRGFFNIAKNISSTVREKTLSTVAGAADFATGGRFDFDKKGSSDTDNVSLLGKVIDAVVPPPTTATDTSVLAPANRSNTSEVIIRPTSSSIPFIRTVKNQYLSTNPNTNKLPPEIARLIQ